MSTPASSDSIFWNEVKNLNEEQRTLFDYIKRGIETDDEKQLLLFVSGGVGTGKSYLIQFIAELIKKYYPQVDSGAASRTEVVQVCSMIGRTAQQVAGRTLYSLFPLPIDTKYSSFVPEAQESELKQMLWLIIDDISLLPYEILRLINLTLQEVKNKTTPFGGVNVLLFGDLMQLPPISKDHCFKQTLQYPNEVNLWKEFQMYELTTNIRQRGDVEFTKLLNTLRFGCLDKKQQMLLLSREQVPLEGKFADGAALRVFPDNEHVDGYNEKMTKILRAQGQTIFTIKAIDRYLLSGAIPAKEMIPSNYNHCGGLPADIELAVGMKVMLKRKIPGEEGLENGVVGVIKDFIWSTSADTSQSCDGELPQAVQIDFVDPALGLKMITPVTAIFQGKDERWGFIERRMLPLVNLWWATTIHKLQGTSLESGVLDLSNIFQYRGHSKLYVALGCVKSLQGLALPNINRNVFDFRPDENVIAEMDRLRKQSKLNI